MITLQLPLLLGLGARTRGWTRWEANRDEIKRVRNGRVLLVPASDQTAGHGTTAQARFWKQDLAELLQSAARRGK
jgi:hypothetical protein